MSRHGTARSETVGRVTSNGHHPKASVAERQVEALSAIGKTIVSGVDYEQVLAALIEKVAKILGSRGGGFMLFDPATGELVTQKPAFGLTDDLVDAYHVPLVAGGNAVSVFVSGQPYISNDAQNDPRVIKHFAQLHGITRLATVPLQIEGRSIGVFHAIDKVSGDFTRDDVALLQLMAPSLAVLIQSAGMMRQLRDREHQLQRVVEVHNELTEILLSGQELSALVARLSQLTGAPIAVLDSAGEVIARPPKDSSTEVMDRAIEMAVEAVAPVPGNGEGHIAAHGMLQISANRTAILVPMRVGSESLGYLVCVAGEDSMKADDLRVLQQASMVVALEIAKERELYEVRRRLNADILEHVFLSQSEDEAVKLLAQLGVRRATSYRGGIFEARSNLSDVTLSSQFQVAKLRIARQLQEALRVVYPDAAVIERQQHLWVVIPQNDRNESTAKAVDEMTKVARRLRPFIESHPRSGFLFAIGASVARATELRKSFEQAEIARNVQRRAGPENRVVFFDQLGIFRLLAQPSGERDHREFVERILGPVLQYDDSHEASWVPFLNDLVASNFSVKLTASKSGRHVNTVKYRVRRLEQLLGRNFNDSKARFEVQLALEVLNLRAVLSGSAD